MHYRHARDLLAELDAAAWRFSDRFPTSIRERIRELSRKSPRFQVIAKRFPVLAFKIADRDDALNLIEQPFRDTAALLDLPIELQWLPADLISGGVGNGFDYTRFFIYAAKRCPGLFSYDFMLSMPPEDEFEMAYWAGAVCAASNYGKVFAHWVARNVKPLEWHFDGYSLNRFFKAYCATGHLGNQLFDPNKIGPPEYWQSHFDRDFDRLLYRRPAYIDPDAPPFDPSMAVEAVIRLAYPPRPPFNGPFPEPWLLGASIDGYTIEPIITADDLRHEGDRMNHCAGTYAESVAAGGNYFYRVCQQGDGIATVRLIRSGNGYRVADIQGVSNANPPNEVTKAVRHWIASAGRRA